MAHGWSRKSRAIHGEEPFRGEQEAIIRYSRKYLEKEGYDFLVFGHRHCPVDYPLNDRSRLMILGDWVTHFSYAVFDGEQLSLKTL
jgi:UDP-2,3-diacylglucosamine hydrolase